MPVLPLASFTPNPDGRGRRGRRGRSMVVVAVVFALIFAGVLVWSLLAPPTASGHVVTMVPAAARLGEVKVAVSHVDRRSQTELLELLDGLAKRSLAEGVVVATTGSSTRSRSFVMKANDPQTVIGDWFDFDAFVANANFLCRPLFDAIDERAEFECTVEHKPIHGGDRLISRVVRTDGTLHFEPPLAR